MTEFLHMTWVRGSGLYLAVFITVYIDGSIPTSIVHRLMLALLVIGVAFGMGAVWAAAQRAYPNKEI